MMKTTFYIVGTPIGNMEDMTFRAVRVLKEVDLILCEDVSNTQKILKHFEIKTKCTNYFANSRLGKIEEIIGMLKDGKNLALVSDAGMPTISDPGSLLIQKIYEAKEEVEVDIKVVPGPTALASALALSGFTGGEFVFYGFLPHKKGRETIFKEVSENKKISVFYESVHRVEKCLESLEKFLDEDRKIVIAKELTRFMKRWLEEKPKKSKNILQKIQKKLRENL